MSYPTRIDSCAVCGTTFKTASRVRAYCSAKCRARACRLRYGDEPQTPVEQTSGGIAPRKVPKYKCADCEKHGIHSPTDWKPCIVCAGRKARAGR